MTKKIKFRELIRGVPLSPFSALLPLILIILIINMSFASAAETGISYKVNFEGVSDKDLLAEINSLSNTLKLKDRPPASINILRKRVDGDINRFLQLLRSRGFYGSSVKIDIASKEKPVLITFLIDTGPQFLLRSVDIQIISIPSSIEIGPPGSDDIGISLNTPFRARSVRDGQRELINFFRKRGFPFAAIENREILVDHNDQSVKITFLVAPGPYALFGSTTITGLIGVDESFILGEIPWKEGDPYDADLITNARTKLSDLGLFATVRIIEGNNLDNYSRLPITIEIKERKHKSFGVGVNYQSDEGPGVKLSWEHRNLMGKGERLGVYGEISDFTMAAESRYRKPDFLIDDQSLRASIRLAEDNPDAFKSKNLSSSVLVERNLSNRLLVGGGMAFKSSKIEQLRVEESFNLISLPGYLEWDNSDDLLDPGKGGRLSLQLTPFYSSTGSQMIYGKALTSYSHYSPILQKPLTIFAGNITLGTIRGVDRYEIPADERFYAGGGGSIRGYAFQSVGPYSNGIPVGGKSLIEVSMEFRLRLSDRFGFVGFLDGGNAFTESMLSSSEDMRWGTGFGVRYFTPIGPLRLDVGVPLNRRDGIDDSFQVYINLGQAF